MFKKYLIAIISITAALLLFSACEKAAPASIDLPEDFPTDIGQTAQETMPITWGFAIQAGEAPGESEIAKTLNERFQISLTSTVCTGDDMAQFQTELAQNGNLPDIFIPYAGEGVQIDPGAIRKIPWDMLEQHAPRYAAMISRFEQLKEFLTADPAGIDLLPGMEWMEPTLSIFSIYRLDWLENIGVTPHGDVQEIGSGLYFTDSAFSMSEFTSILRDFAEQSTEEVPMRGITLSGDEGAFGAWYDTAPLLGMWGLDLNGFDSNIENDGHALYGFASEGFRSYLELMERLIQMGAVETGSDEPDGWWCGDVYFLLGENGLLENYLNENPGAKLLIAPPEVGPDGTQGAHSFYDPKHDISAMGTNYYISAQVGDEKLIRILEIFDAISFDPSLYVLTHFGVEGEDFTWSGEPYDSCVVPVNGDIPGAGAYITNVLDGTAGRNIYTYPSEGLYRFAASDRGRAMMLRPYKVDPDGERLDEAMELMGKYPDNDLTTLATRYYQEIISGAKDVAHSWDEYIAVLESNGLAEWNELFDRYPYTSGKG